MKEGSMLGAAYRILLAEGKSMRFVDLWAAVKKEMEVSNLEEELYIGRFYTDLSLSGQFVVLGENVWDLRERHTYDKVHIEVKDVYSALDERDVDAVDAAENADYDKYVRGDVGDDDDSGEDDESGESGPKPREDAAELLGIKDGDY